MDSIVILSLQTNENDNVLIGIADFVREARNEHVNIDRATASVLIARGFEYPTIVITRGISRVDAEIYDIAACATIVKKMEII
jgi:hypothetical protein